MKLMLFRSLALVAILMMVTLFPAAQSADGQSSKTGQIFVGETLKYEGKVNKIIHGITIADLTFSAAMAPDSNALVIRTEAVSKGTLLKLFHYSFLQQYESTVDLSTFRILKTTKHDVQKERVRDSEAIFDYRGKRVRYVETDPKDRNRPPRNIASEITEHMSDLVSAVYAVRLQPLKIGKRFDLSISDSGLVFTVPVVVTSREEQKTILGKRWCFRIEPQIFGNGRLIERKGKMVVWMTDDPRHIPVRAEVDADFGKIIIKLKSDTKPK
jgi:hypothetical protein